MAIITISRQMGSFGTKIAKSLQEKTGYSFLDKESLEKELVNKYGIPEDQVKRYDEKKPPLRDMFSSDKDRYMYFLKSTMYESARQDNCIVMGRRVQMLFADIPGALHIKIVAPYDLRIKRVKEEFKYNDELAEQVIKHNDHDRAGFHKYFFHVNWDDSPLYDLIINTQHFSVYAAVKLIEDACHSASILEHQIEGEKKLVDLCLSQEVYTRIVYTEKMPVYLLRVLVEDGVVTLKGAMTIDKDVYRSEKIASDVEGVKKVINEMHYMPTVYGF